MAVYFWIGAMGMIGLMAMILFFIYFLRDIKTCKKFKFSKVKMIPNWILLLVSLGSFTSMVYCFIYIKEQLLQFS